MRAKSISDHNRVVRLEDWNGLKLDGSEDMSPILTAAMTQAAAAKYPVIGPSGSMLLASTVELVAPLIGPSNPRGDANSRLKLVPGMTNGTAMLERVLGNGYHVENIFLGSAITNPSAAVNAIGLKLGTVGGGGLGGVGTATKYGFLGNVAANGLAVGFEIQGWSSVMRNLVAYNCALGLKAEFMNNCVLELECGGCAQGFTLANTGTLTVLRYGEEGAYLSTASAIDGSHDIIFNNYRTEQVTGPAVPWLKVGATTLVKNLRILSGQFSYTSAGVYPVELDNVDGWEIGAHIYNSSTSRRGIKTTPNTRNQRGPLPKLTYAYPFVPQTAEAAITDNRRDMQRPVEIFNANPFMDGLRFGCYNVQAYASTGAAPTIAEDTTTFRTGNSSLKIEAGATGTYQCVEWRYSESWVAALAGQTITFVARIFIPSTVDVKGEGGAGSGTLYPAVYIKNAADTLIGASENGYALAGGWNLLHCKATIPAAATEIRVGVYANRSANTAATGARINVDFMAIAAGDVWEQLEAGNFVQSQLCRGTMANGRLTVHLSKSEATTMLSDTTQTWEVGDRIIYTDAAAGEVEGKRLTATGWKDFGVIEA